MDPTFARILAPFSGPAPVASPAPPAGGEPPPSPEDELVAGAVRDLTLAAAIVTGRRWACRGDQDLWHEGADSESACEDPLRLDSLVRAAYHAAGGGRPTREDLAHAAVGRLAGWSAGHLRHLFGQPLAAPALAAALDRLAAYTPPAVDYFRRHEAPDRAFRPGRPLLAGGALPLTPFTLRATPADPESTRHLYVRSVERAEVPPAAGPRPAADG